MSNQNYYKANLRDLSFLLFEQFKLGDLLGKEPYANWGKDDDAGIKALEENMVLDANFKDTRQKLYALLLGKADTLTLNALSHEQHKGDDEADDR